MLRGQEAPTEPDLPLGGAGARPRRSGQERGDPAALLGRAPGAALPPPDCCRSVAEPAREAGPRPSGPGGSGAGRLQVVRILGRGPRRRWGLPPGPGGACPRPPAARRPGSEPQPRGSARPAPPPPIPRRAFQPWGRLRARGWAGGRAAPGGSRRAREGEPQGRRRAAAAGRLRGTASCPAPGAVDGGSPTGPEPASFPAAPSATDEPAAGRLCRRPLPPLSPVLRTAPRLAELSSGEARPGGGGGGRGRAGSGVAARKRTGEARGLAAGSGRGGGGPPTGVGDRRPRCRERRTRRRRRRRKLLPALGAGTGRPSPPARPSPARRPSAPPRAGLRAAGPGSSAEPRCAEPAHRRASSEGGRGTGTPTRWVGTGRAAPVGGPAAGAAAAARSGPRGPGRVGATAGRGGGGGRKGECLRRRCPRRSAGTGIPAWLGLSLSGMWLALRAPLRCVLGSRACTVF